MRNLLVFGAFVCHCPQTICPALARETRKRDVSALATFMRMKTVILEQRVLRTRSCSVLDSPQLLIVLCMSVSIVYLDLSFPCCCSCCLHIPCNWRLRPTAAQQAVASGVMARIGACAAILSAVACLGADGAGPTISSVTPVCGESASTMEVSSFFFLSPRLSNTWLGVARVLAEDG